jgi:hypothetical protein
VGGDRVLRLEEVILAEKEIDWFSRATSLLGLCVSIASIGAVAISFYALKQTDTSARLGRALSAYQEMVSRSEDVDKVLVEHPAMRPYFRDRKPLSHADEDYNLAAAIAEMRLDAFDALLEFPDLMGFESQAESWRNTARDAFRDSPLMCDLAASYKANYGPTIVKLANEGCSPTR